MGNSREEKIDQWIFQEGIKNDRRSRIIPSSTDQITHTPVGTGLDAMEKIAFYFGDRPQLPTVELGQIKEHEITLTFGQAVELEAPFFQVDDEHLDQWAITHPDALELSTGGVYGHQTMALTAIGNSLAGAKVLLNTSRWQLLGSVGLARFTTSLMVGQVMEQATEPWAQDQHLWLVGYQELGPKLVSFLASYHDESRFHLVESLEQITAKDLTGTSATLYVMGSSPASLEPYERIRSETVGMLTDTVVTELAMFISEDEDGAATVVNAGPYGLKIWPNLVGEGDHLYEAMDITWTKRQEEAKAAEEAVEELTVENFMPPTENPEEEAGATSISVADLEALMNQEVVVPDHEQTPVPDEEPACVEPVAEEPAPAVAEEEAQDPQPPSDTEAAAAPTTGPFLSLLGNPQIHGEGTTAGAKAAEAAAYLQLHGLSAEAGEVTAALWPDADAEGHAARTRRTRTAKKIKDTWPGIFHNDTTWQIDPVPTDLEAITAALGPDGDPQEAVRACQGIEAPLQGCAPWADAHRERITAQLRQVLEEAADQALENDQFELAKAARQASKKL